MLLTETEINNRDLPDPGSAGLCLESEHNHKNILTRVKAFVNDINQSQKVLIVLDDLSDKQL
jgi:hypothetical protein